jgi:membrane fusion protein, multidrug efflux system
MSDDTELLLRPDPAEAPAARRTAPRGQPEMAPRTSSALAERPRSSRRPWLRWALFLLLPIALIAGGYLYVTSGQVMSTDDA